MKINEVISESRDEIIDFTGNAALDKKLTSQYPNEEEISFSPSGSADDFVSFVANIANKLTIKQLTKIRDHFDPSTPAYSERDHFENTAYDGIDEIITEKLPSQEKDKRALESYLDKLSEEPITPDGELVYANFKIQLDDENVKRIIDAIVKGSDNIDGEEYDSYENKRRSILSAVIDWAIQNKSQLSQKSIVYIIKKSHRFGDITGRGGDRIKELYDLYDGDVMKLGAKLDDDYVNDRKEELEAERERIEAEKEKTRFEKISNQLSNKKIEFILAKLSKNYWNTIESAEPYLEKMLNSRNGTYEQLMLSNKDYQRAIEYAKAVIGGRWKELESKLVSNTDGKLLYAIQYQEEVLKTEWPKLRTRAYQELKKNDDYWESRSALELLTNSFTKRDPLTEKILLKIEKDKIDSLIKSRSTVWSVGPQSDVVKYYARKMFVNSSWKELEDLNAYKK